MVVYPEKIQITHLPSGEVVVVQRFSNKTSMKEVKEKAMKILASRRYAIEHGMGRSDKIVFDTTLKDDDPIFPNELSHYRKKL